MNREPQTCSVQCLDLLTETMFGTTVDPSEVAAVIVEPVQGEGGYVVPHPQFLPRLREITRRHGILLIADEVQCGMGRTGRLFASEHFGLEPDIVTLAKGIASGMPLGALVARDDVMRWNDGGHGSTFGGNPVSVAAALATFRLLEGGLVDNAARVGARLLEPLRARLGRHMVVGDVRGLGLMIGVEIVRDRFRARAGAGAARARPAGGLPARASCSWAAARARSAWRRPWSSTTEDADTPSASSTRRSPRRVG